MILRIEGTTSFLYPLVFDWTGIGLLATLGGMFSLKQGLTDAAHEFVFLGCGREDYLLFSGLTLAIELADGELQAMFFILTERIRQPGGQPFGDHFDILE